MARALGDWGWRSRDFYFLLELVNLARLRCWSCIVNATDVYIL